LVPKSTLEKKKSTVNYDFSYFLFEQTLVYCCVIIKYDYNTMGMDKTILIIEKDPILLGIYKEILELYDYNVQIASNGAEGIEKFKQTNPSLIVIAGEMPVHDGYDTFKQIKEIDKNAIAVIITGGIEFESKNQEALD